jgi:hypothetical protein
MIAFPNEMRSFDEDAGTFRFSGYDGVMEVRFVLEAPALERIAGISWTTAAAYLDAFDQFRKPIQAAALKAHQRTHKSMIRLTTADF